MSDDELDRERVLIGLTDRAAAGLACPVCGRPVSHKSDAPMRPVGRSETGVQVLACAWPCVAEIARRQRG